MAKTNSITQTDIEDREKRDLPEVKLPEKIVDLEWLQNIEDNHVPHSKTNSIKEQLEVQWTKPKNLEDLGKEVEVEPVTIIKEMKGITRNPKKLIRTSMMKGLLGKDLAKDIMSNFTKEEIKANEKDIKDVLKYEGIVGCIAIHGDDYKNAKEAKKLINACPNGQFIKYVILTPEDPKFRELETKTVAPVMEEGTMDNFLDNKVKISSMKQRFCSETKMPILSFREEAEIPSNEKSDSTSPSPLGIDKEEMKKAREEVIDIFGSLGVLTGNQKDIISSMDISDSEKICLAFQTVKANSLGKKSSVKEVNAEEFKVGSLFVVEANEKIASENVEFNGSSLSFDGIMENETTRPPIEFKQANQKDINIKNEMVYNKYFGNEKRDKTRDEFDFSGGWNVDI